MPSSSPSARDGFLAATFSLGCCMGSCSEVWEAAKGQRAPLEAAMAAKAEGEAAAPKKESLERRRGKRVRLRGCASLAKAGKFFQRG